MTKQTIEIEGLPEGWRAVAYRIALRGVDHVLRNGKVTIYNGFSDDENLLIVEKIQPRRIVLEETEEERSVSYGDWYEDDLGRVNQWLNKSYGSSRCVKIWKQVKE